MGLMDAPLLSASTTVARALQDYPEIMGVLVGKRTACVGCSMGRFCTLMDASISYNLSWDAFLADLKSAVKELNGIKGGKYG